MSDSEVTQDLTASLCVFCSNELQKRGEMPSHKAEGSTGVLGLSERPTRATACGCTTHPQGFLNSCWDVQTWTHLAQLCRRLGHWDGNCCVGSGACNKVPKECQQQNRSGGNATLS